MKFLELIYCPKCKTETDHWVYEERDEYSNQIIVYKIECIECKDKIKREG